MTLANRVTLIRFILTPFFVASLVYYEPQKETLRLTAIFIFLFAMITDALDGYLAKRYSQRSPLGIILDPLADKLLLVSGFVAMATLENLPPDLRIPAWISILVVSRDIFILSGSFVIYLVTQHLDVKPSRWGKAATFFQMVTILVVLCAFPLTLLCYGLTAFFTVLSGLGYLRYGAKLLNGYQSSS